MNTRRLFSVCAVLATLMFSDISATADETGSTVASALSGTTLGGYADTTVSRRFQPALGTQYYDSRGWLGRISRWLGFHRQG